MRTALLLLVFVLGCRTAPGPAAPRTAEPTDAGGDATAIVAPPKDPLPAAVERLVQLFEVIAALPPAPSCEQNRAAARTARADYRDAVTLVLQARTERPVELEALWSAHQTRLTAAWLALQRWPCEGADAIDLLSE